MVDEAAAPTTITGDEVSALRGALLTQTRLLDLLIHGLSLLESPKFTSQDIEVANTTLLMVQALGVSTHSFLKLTAQRDMAIRDCYGIARSATELAVNICYLGASGSEIANLAQQHALQKLYRDTKREGEVAGIRFYITRHGTHDLDDIDGLREAIAQFTNKKGKEKRDWIDVGLDDRIRTVETHSKRAAYFLSYAYIAIYRHGSEFLHGTYFSVAHFWIEMGPKPVGLVGFNSGWGKHFAAVALPLFFSSAAVLEMISQRFGMDHAQEASRNLVSDVKDLLLALDQTTASAPSDPNSSPTV